MMQRERGRARLAFLAASVAAVLGLTQAAHADDIVDSGKKPGGAFDGGAEVNLNLTNGNVNIRTIGGAAEASLRTDRFTTRARASYITNKTAGAERARTILGNLRTGTNLVNNIDVFAQGNYFQNRFAGVTDQWEGDAGLGFYAFNSDATSLHVEGGLGYLHENLTVVDKNSFLLWRAGAGLRLKLSEAAALETDASFIDSFRNSNDWRVTGGVGLTSAITQALSMKLSYNLMHRHLPVPTFGRYDATTVASLAVKF